MKRGNRFTFSSILDENMSVVLQVSCEGGWSCAHSLLQFGGESTDLEGLFSLLDWFGFLGA